MSASSSRSPGTPSKRMPTSITSGKRSRGSTRNSSESYSPKASLGSSVRASSWPTSLPSSASSTLGKMPPNPPWRYSSRAPSSSRSRPSQSLSSKSSFTTLPRLIRMRLVEGLANRQHFVDMGPGTHILQDVPHDALLVDDEGRAQQARLRMAVDDLSLDHVVEAADFLFGVGEELHGEAVLVAERLVGQHVVFRNAEDDGVELHEFVFAIAEPDRLDGAAGRAVPRIEIEDDVLLAPVAGEIHHLHAGVGELE